MKAFAKTLGEDQTLRTMYRADPIRALAHYGIEEISVEELMSQETVEAFGELFGQDLKDADAYTRILEFVASGGH